MTNEPDFIKFLETYPPVNTTPATDELVERYLNVVPENLLQLWKQHGFGTYGNGFIQIINPDEYRETLSMWLLREDDGTRIPFALSAFGDVFYWRHLHNPEPTEDIPEWVFDVSFFDPHTSETGLCAYSMGEFFGEYIVDEETANLFKRQFHSGYSVGVVEEHLNSNAHAGGRTLFDKSLDKMGVLEPGEMYYFVPALRLGGSDDIDYVEKGSALVQLDLLFQLTEEEPYDAKSDPYDYYNETSQLNTPADYDRRIEELKAEMDGTDDAYKHYMIGKLLQHYPAYDESIQNYDLVVERTQQDAIHHFNKAKELDAQNPKYFMSSFRHLVSIYGKGHLDAAFLDLERYHDLTGDDLEYFRGRFSLAQENHNPDEILDYGMRIFNLTLDYQDMDNTAFSLHSLNPEKSEELYKKVLQEADSFDSALSSTRNLAFLLAEQKRGYEIESVYDELLAKYPEHAAEIYNAKGTSIQNDWENEDRYHRALAAHDKALEFLGDLEVDPYELAMMHFNRYTCLERMERYDEALEAINTALSIEENPYNQEQKAKLLYKMGREDEAQEMASQTEQFDTSFRKSFDEGNWQEIVWSLDGRPSAFDKRIEKLEAELEQNSTDAQKQFLLAKLFENYPIYQVAEEAQEEQQTYVYNGAFVAYCEATELEPDNYIYHYHLAEFLLQYRYQVEIEEETAIQIMEEGYQMYINQAEDPYKGYDGLKSIAMWQDDWEKIIEYAKKCYEVNPEEKYNLVHIGNAYRELGRYNEAANAYQEYIQESTEAYEINRGKQGLAQTYIAMGDSARALHLIEDLAASTPDDNDRADAYMSGADGFRFEGKHEEAVMLQEKAYQISLNIKDPYVRNLHAFNLATHYEEAGRYKDAIPLLQNLTKTRGDAYDFTYLGNLLKADGQTDAAREAYEKALKIDPDDEHTQELLDELPEKKKGGGFFGKWF